MTDGRLGPPRRSGERGSLMVVALCSRGCRAHVGASGAGAADPTRRSVLAPVVATRRRARSCCRRDGTLVPRRGGHSRSRCGRAARAAVIRHAAQMFRVRGSGPFRAARAAVRADSRWRRRRCRRCRRPNTSIGRRAVTDDASYRREASASPTAVARPSRRRPRAAVDSVDDRRTSAPLAGALRGGAAEYDLGDRAFQPTGLGGEGRDPGRRALPGGLGRRPLSHRAVHARQPRVVLPGAACGLPVAVPRRDGTRFPTTRATTTRRRGWRATATSSFR